MLKSAEMIKTALNEVGCEELPSGCDDLSVEPNFIENNGSPVDQPVSVVCNRHFFFSFVKTGARFNCYTMGVDVIAGRCGNLRVHNKG